MRGHTMKEEQKEMENPRQKETERDREGGRE
jgi:hypothetical protein